MIYINEKMVKDGCFGSWSWDIPKKLVTFTPDWFLSLGYPVPKNLTQNIDYWESLIHPDDKSFVMELLDRHFDNKTFIFHSVYRLLQKSGLYLPNLDVGMVLVRNSSGDPLKMNGVNVDLSKTKFTQKELEDSTNLYNLNKCTPKEVEICELIKKGYNRNDIATCLFISPNTVKTHLSHIYPKFNIESWNQLLSILYKNSLIEIVLPEEKNIEDQIYY